ncbi:hypothetical protein [Halosimplex carlsbadense]|nr:hypothetical protein [Halosimplex carlsbadense]
MIIQMSGLTSILMGGDSVGMIRADDELSESVDNTSMNTTGSPDSSSNGGFFQFVTGGLTKLINFAEMVLILPETLTALPLFPWWFAYPIGIAGEAVVVIGIAETAANREWT